MKKETNEKEEFMVCPSMFSVYHRMQVEKKIKDVRK